MRVFLSWSGDRSQYVAEQFSEWLPVVIQGVATFMSEHDVEAGSRWARKIDEELEATDFGILFVTPESQHAPWLVHEAGALGKSIDESRVVPLLIDMAPSDLDWPLARFQAVELGEEGVNDLLDSINEALGEDQLDSNVLESSFEAHWPSLEKDLQDIPPLPEGDAATEEDTPEEAQRRRDEKLDEVLELVRSMSRGGGEELLKNVLDRIDELESQITSLSGGGRSAPFASSVLSSPHPEEESSTSMMPLPLDTEQTEELTSWLHHHPAIRTARVIESPDGDTWLQINHSPSTSESEVREIVDAMAIDYAEAEDGK